MATGRFENAYFFFIVGGSENGGAIGWLTAELFSNVEKNKLTQFFWFSRMGFTGGG